MKKTLLVYAWLAPFFLSAQQPAPAWLVKIPPLVWLHPYTPAIDVAVERRITNNWHAELSLGKLINLGFADNPVLSDVDGYRVQTGAKYYFSPPASRRYAQFVQAFGAFHQADAYIEGDFCRFGCSYLQRLNYLRRERKLAFFAAYGGSLLFSKRFIFEFDAGLGFVQRDIGFGNVPSDATFRTNGSLIWNYTADEVRQQIEPSLRLKLGVVIY